MNNTINGRTPEEIKDGLEHCSKDEDGCNCEGCPYDMGEFTCKCIPVNQKDALAYIQQLEERIVDLNKTSEQLERERDAAVEDIFPMCANCKHEKLGYGVGPCPPIEEYVTTDCSNWQWRGVPQEVE